MLLEGSAVPCGSSVDSDSVLVITHFLRRSFIFSVLPSVFLKRLSFPSARLCRNWLLGSLSPQGEGVGGLYPQLSASFLGAVHRSQQPLVSASLFWAVLGRGKWIYFRPVEVE